MQDLTGKQLGPYQIVAPLGEGGMAAVYKAYQPGMERYVALKILPQHFAGDPEFVGRFKQEAKLLANLQHPHILPVHDFGEAEGFTYIVMPLLASGDLTDLMRGQSLSLLQIRRITSQVGDALDYAHQRGLIHRDVKPSNILLDERGNCLLTDFGIAKITESSEKFTATGAFIGTPAYMSPEQGLGHKLDGRSDIYALGIVLYEMAAGRVPYRAETPLAVVVKHINDPLPLPHQVNPAIPESLERVILKALAKQPDDRYATAGQMVQALQMALPEMVEGSQVMMDEGATMQSPVVSTISEPKQASAQAIPPQSRSSSNLPWIIGAVLVTLILIGGGVFFMVGRGDSTTPQATIASTEPLKVADISPTVTPAQTSQPLNNGPDQYDNFDDAAFDSAFNTELWDFFSDSGEGQIVQENGVLRLTHEGESEIAIGLSARHYYDFTVEEPMFFEADLKIEPAEAGHVYLFVGSSLETEDYADCYLATAEAEAYISCNYFENDEYVFELEGQVVEHNSWHTVRFEIDPATMIFSYYVDGESMGQFESPNAEELQDTEFFVDVGLWSETDATLTGYVDNVNIGTLE